MALVYHTSNFPDVIMQLSYTSFRPIQFALEKKGLSVYCKQAIAFLNVCTLIWELSA